LAAEATDASLLLFENGLRSLTVFFMAPNTQRHLSIASRRIGKTASFWSSDCGDSVSTDDSKSEDKPESIDQELAQPEVMTLNGYRTWKKTILGLWWCGGT